jgi:hypothetical protein
MMKRALHYIELACYYVLLTCKEKRKIDDMIYPKRKLSLISYEKCHIPYHYPTTISDCQSAIRFFFFFFLFFFLLTIIDLKIN